MNILVLKLLLAPLIIGGASLAGRRWGPTVSGWLIGLPLTSGPVVFFIAISHSPAFASATILGTLSGGFSLVAFCLSYAWLAMRFRWPIAISGSLICFFTLTLVMQNLVLALPFLFCSVLLTIFIGLRLMPKTQATETQDAKPGKWDLPARVLIGTSFILGLTSLAPFIGARLTGLLSTIPIYTAILTVFAQRIQGPPAATSVLRGLLYGLFGFAAFYLTLALLLERTGTGPAFTTAILVTLVTQGISLLLIQNHQK